MTQLTSGGAVTAFTNRCVNDVETSRPINRFFGLAGHTYSIIHIAVTLAPSHSLIIHTCNTNNSTRITVTATTAST